MTKRQCKLIKNLFTVFMISDFCISYNSITFISGFLEFSYNGNNFNSFISYFYSIMSQVYNVDITIERFITALSTYYGNAKIKELLLK